MAAQQCDICGTPVETPDTYRRRAEAAERAAAAAADEADSEVSCSTMATTGGHL